MAIIDSFIMDSTNYDLADKYSIHYTAQTLTADQKLQARENIDAVSGERIDNVNRKFEPTAATLSSLLAYVNKINGGTLRDQTLYDLFERIEDLTLDNLQDENGNLLQFPNLRIKGYSDNSNTVRYDIQQALSAVQKLQVRENIDAAGIDYVDNVNDKFEPVAAMLAALLTRINQINGGENRDKTLYDLLESVYDLTLDDLRDESGNLIQFPTLQLKNSGDKNAVHYNEVQSLTQEQKVQAQENIDAASTSNLKGVNSKFEPVADTLAGLLTRLNKINGGSYRDETLYNLLETVDNVTLEDLRAENGSLLEFPSLQLKDYYNKSSVSQMLNDKVNPMVTTLASLVKGKSEEDIIKYLEVTYDILEDNAGNPLLEEDGELLLGGQFAFKNAGAFKPEDYQYNSGTGGYYQYTAIPILYMYGDAAAMTKDKKAKLTARFKDIRMGCSCKWQGSSSLTYPKKNYTVTFNSPVLIVPEWGMKKKYVLKSEFFDNTHTRNTVAGRLWAEIVQDREKRNGATTLDDENGVPFTLESGTGTLEIVNSPIMGAPGKGAIDGFHVMVVINNQYMGLYTMGIPKDDWMFGMDNGSPNCCVLNAEKNCPATKFSATTTPEEIENEETFTVEYASDDMNIDRIANSVNTMLSAIINASGSTYRETIEQYFDVDCAIDYTIFSLLTANWDGISHNYNLVTYDGVKWMFSAYDLDNTFGMEDLVGWTFNTLYDNPTVARPNLPTPLSDNRLMYIIQQYGKDEFKERYHYLRSGILSEYNIYTKFYNFICCVSKRVLAEEYNIWPTTPRSGAHSIDAILNFYRLRCMYMDAAVEKL